MAWEVDLGRGKFLFPLEGIPVPPGPGAVTRSKRENVAQPKAIDPGLPEIQLI